LTSFYQTTAICILAAYVIGAMPFGYWLSKLKGIDIREHGSGNIGATNVFRVVGPKVGISVFVLDIFKGFLPVFAGKRIIEPTLSGIDTADQWLGAAAVALALAAIIGHNYTFFLGFKGGKGIATSAGAMLAFLPIVLATSLATWILTLYFSGYVALASIAAALSIPPTTFVLGWISGEINYPVIFFGVFASIMAIWRHRSNIKRLLAGEEDRFDRKSKKVKIADTDAS
jgi:glycerol-3-phosphate acyltransferase PlsY